ncbi:MAG: hypothetical protein D5R97_10015 [Candidatus Syntrophonatronum acetioxidans]|uniref:Cyclophilin TM1367-like domain-containing protein n=1 Tax=Candidatus Syntrophonatronum acetioxidans TaxID=1795816 RepID=A0A424YAB1_9FIRM|nr:MAG: hypothetical protein D5R97_10015 [Candidatus Syntrophonatronum acetioxidans]
MPYKISIQVNEHKFSGELNDTKTAKRVYEALPFEARGNTWGDEIYFEIPVSAGLEKDAREVVQKGDLGYWPTGEAFCIFYGLTPASKSEDEIRPASAVNVIGRIHEDVEILKGTSGPIKVKVEKENN